MDMTELSDSLSRQRISRGALRQRIVTGYGSSFTPKGCGVHTAAKGETSMTRGESSWSAAIKKHEGFDKNVEALLFSSFDFKKYPFTFVHLGLPISTQARIMTGAIALFPYLQ